MIKRTFGSNILVLFGYSQILLAANLPRTNEKSLAKHPPVSAAARSWSTQRYKHAPAARLPSAAEHIYGLIFAVSSRSRHGLRTAAGRI
jgi:hypothetical protein